MDRSVAVRLLALPLLAAFVPFALGAQTAPRPMTWLDVQNMRQVGAPAPSPDGRNVLYTLSTPDWKETRRQSDIYLVNTQQGVPSTKRLTFTTDKSETSPAWTRDGQWFVFASDRDAPAAGAAGGAGASRDARQHAAHHRLGHAVLSAGSGRLGRRIESVVHHAHRRWRGAQDHRCA